MIPGTRLHARKPAPHVSALALAVLLFASIRPARAEPLPDPNRGLYAVWADDPQVAALPALRGGQVVCQWAEAEPSEGRYDFSRLDEELARLQRLGLVATIQLNGSVHPAYLFLKVPHSPVRLSIQTRDRAGTLAYWHPAYAAAYARMIGALASHLKALPNRGELLGVRLNFNAIGTEHLVVPPEERNPSRWSVPAGAAPAPAWTPALAAAYQRQVVEEYVRQFTPQIRVFVRNNLLAGSDPEPRLVQLASSGTVGLFHTSSEMEPRAGNGGQYQAFLRFCRTGETTAYAEPWADAEGNHGGKRDPRWCGPEQWNYWRLLCDLNCGVSFVALYGADIARAHEPEFRDAFEFAARYAGYQASPSLAPGAWVALREGDTLPGDYTFLMRRLPGDAPPLRSVGPAHQRFGAWARRIPAGKEAGFALDPAFAASLRGSRPSLNLSYLDEGMGAFSAAAGGQTFPIARTGSGRWKTVRFPIAGSSLSADPSGAHIVVRAEQDVVLHMVELARQREPGSPRQRWR